MHDAPATAIIPDKLNSVGEAADLIPSCRKGRKVHPTRLRRWIAEGRLHGEPRDSGGMRY